MLFSIAVASVVLGLIGVWRWGGLEAPGPGADVNAVSRYVFNLNVAFSSGCCLNQAETMRMLSISSAGRGAPAVSCGG